MVRRVEFFDSRDDLDITASPLVRSHLEPLTPGASSPSLQDLQRSTQKFKNTLEDFKKRVIESKETKEKQKTVMVPV